MCVAIAPAADLSATQFAALQARVEAPEHAHDRGACLFWQREGALPKLFVAVLPASGIPTASRTWTGPCITCIRRGGSTPRTVAKGWART